MELTVTDDKLPITRLLDIIGVGDMCLPCSFVSTLELTVTNDELIVAWPLETASDGNINAAEEDFATEETNKNVDTLSSFHF